MNDLMTMCILGIIVIVGLIVVMSLLRNMNRDSATGNTNSPEEGYHPEYDDPDIQSRGGFGRNRRGFGNLGGSRSSGGFGSTETPKSGSSSGSSGGRIDSPNVRSRGGFGRNKR